MPVNQLEVTMYDKNVVLAFHYAGYEEYECVE